tara:strand:- start:1043 stop:1219 length:177 start_codon:yes stop_codon:yes gene_type:complete
MKVGDLVKAPYWDENQTAIVISTKRLKPDKTGIVRVLGSFGWELDQLARDMEIISESR